jgi:hypothetical protein
MNEEINATNDTNNEVARLRELLNRAIETCLDLYDTKTRDNVSGETIEELILAKNRLAPAPEEPVTKKCAACVPEEQCWECAPSVYEQELPLEKIANTPEPAPEWRELLPDEEICEGDEKFVGRGPWLTQAMYIGKNAGKYPFIRFRTRRPLPDPVPTQPPTQNEWRELGKDEVIQMDDMYRSDVSSRNYPVTSVMIGNPVGNFPEYTFRTRRPLPDPVPTQPPTQNEWRIRAEGERIEPLEKELDYLTSEASRAADIHNHVLIVDCLRYLRDEIQKLKEAK